jgi:hypothetical protein
MTDDADFHFICEFFPISETVLSGSHIASSSARVSACLELPQQLRQLGDIRRDPARQQGSTQRYCHKSVLSA